MAIEGPVRELALSDLLQLLFLSRRTGKLIVRDEPSAQSVVLELEDGSLVGASTSGSESRLGRLLVAAGKATDLQVERALATQRESPERRIGEVLAELGWVRAAEVERQLKFQIEEAVFDLMRWRDGHLRFEEGPARAGDGIRVRLPTDLVLMDSARRLDEWAEVTARAPEPDPLPRLAAAAGSSGPPLSLEPFEWEVLAKVDGENTLRRIARSLGRPELEVARAIYSLADVGVVEVGSRIGREREPRIDTYDAESAAAEQALAAGRMGEAKRRIQDLLEARPDSAAVHLLHGRLLLARRDLVGAARSFDRAVGLDPLLPTAYFHLARTAARIGDFGRAREALAAYLRLPDPSSRRRGAAQVLDSGLKQLLRALEEVVE